MGISYQQLKGLVIGVIGFLLMLQFALWFLSHTREVMTLLLISVILAVALRPTVDRLSRHPAPLLRRPMRRALAVLVLYLGIALVLVTLGLLVIPQLVTEAEKLIANAPRYMESVDQWLVGIQSYPFLAGVDLSRMSSQLGTEILGNLPQAVNVLFVAISTLSSLLSIGVILVLTFFLIMEADPIYNHFTSLLPPAHRGHVRQMTARMGIKIEGWLKGTILLSLSIGIPTGLFMWIIGMPFPLLLGVLAGFFEFVPLIGAYLGAAPAILLALFQPTWMLLAVALFFVVLQMAENNILAPMIMGGQVELHPLLIILGLLVGASLMGIMGALLAVPVVAVLQVLWTDLVVPSIKARYTD